MQPPEEAHRPDFSGGRRFLEDPPLFVQISVGGAAPEQRRCSRRSSAVVQISVGEDDFCKILKDSQNNSSSRFQCGEQFRSSAGAAAGAETEEAHRPDFSAGRRFLKDTKGFFGKFRRRPIVQISVGEALPGAVPVQRRCSRRSSPGAVSGAAPVQTPHPPVWPDSPF